MYIEVRVDRLYASNTTDSEDRDEIYLTLGGQDPKGGRVDIQRIAPTGIRYIGDLPIVDEDYYGLQGGQEVTNIMLWSGHIADGEVASFTVILMEQDGDTLGVIANLLAGIGGIAGAIVAIIATGGGSVLADILSGGGAIAGGVASIGRAIDQFDAESAHQVIGSFVINVANMGGELKFGCIGVNTASAVVRDNSAQVGCFGYNAQYDLTVSVTSVPPSRVRNKGSNLCLDIREGIGGNGDNIQQFGCHDGLNQRWFLVPRLPKPENTPSLGLLVSALSFRGFSFRGPVEIVSDLSGGVLDVSGGLLENGTDVVYFTPHGGGNQLWVVATDPRDPDGEVIFNVNSRKCLGVAESSRNSGMNIQQFSYSQQEATRKWHIE